MTIPTRDDALKALDKLSSEYDLAGGWSPDPMPILATLRSYIESHTGEVVTYAVFDKTGKLRFVAPNEHDAHMALILSSADPDEFDVATMVKPLYASPVQPDAALTEALTRIEELEEARHALLRPIGWQDVRLAVGEGKLTNNDVLDGVNAELRRRTTLTKGIKE